MRSFFRLALLALVLLVVAMISALAAMQFAIHGREVNMPNLVGKNPLEARKICDQVGLPMEVERQYYSSTVDEGKVLSQMPPPGTKVRRGWQVRVAESLGPQRIQIPTVLGASERAAEINIRRRGLDISSIAELGIPGMVADRVISQSPPPNASDVSAPKISLLVSGVFQPQTFVMPNFAGQQLGTATAALQAAGLHVEKVYAAQQNPTAQSSLSGTDTPSSPGTLSEPTPASLILSQTPSSGQKIAAGSSVTFVVR